LFGCLSIHSFPLFVLLSDENIQNEWTDNGEDEEENDETGTSVCHHPRKMSTMSLVPEVVSR